jgi:transposase
MDLILMGTRDARRLGMIKAAEAGRITNREAAAGLGLSVRQFRRLRKQVRELGPRGVVHGNRNRPSSRRLAAEVRDRVVALLTGTVKLNDHHISDLLAEDKIEVSPATVRRVRKDLKLPPKRRRRPSRHRRRRTRKARRGELVLIDGSPFHWFDEAGPAWSLMGAIDDATSEILHLTLRPTEDLHGYVSLLHGLIRTQGVPVCLYGDRSGILVRSDKHWTLAEELRGEQDPTQFGRMLIELGVNFIPARSPQAKGRIERLWATLQDRLAAELRLHGITTLAAALAYLPQFIAAHNRRRAVAPAETVTAFRPAPRGLDDILACVYPRVVARDNTVRIPGRWAQLPPGAYRRSWHKARVEVRELLDGRLHVFHPRHGLIAEQAAPEAPFTLESRHSQRSRRLRAKTDAQGSPQKAVPVVARPSTRARAGGVGTLTQIRRPERRHPWHQRFSPQGPPNHTGGKGRTKSLTR